jgi:hypothetical protein
MIDKSRSMPALPRPSAWLWIGLVAVASVATSSKLQCVVPFAALAAVAALHLSRRDGLVLIGTAFAVNQVMGFTVLGYPHDVEAYGWGVAIGVGTLAALAAAEVAHAGTRRMGLAVTATAALTAAFAASQAVLFATRLVLPATDYAFSAPVVAQIALVNAVGFVALMAVCVGLTTTGLVPRRA